MGLSHKRLAFFYALIGLVIVLFFITIPVGQNVDRSNPLVIGTFMLNGLVWTVMLIRSLTEHPYSSQIIHWFFCLFFFFFAALLQYLNGAFPWVGYLSDDTVLYGNIVTLVWTVFFILGTKVKSKHILNIRGISGFTQKKLPLDCGAAMTVSMCICGFIAIYSIATTGFVNLLSRATSATSWSDNSSIGMLIGHSTRAFCVISSLFSAHVIRKTGRFKIRGLIILACLLITSFPTGIERYAMASIFGALFLTFFPSLKRNNFFIAAFMLGFVVILPFLNAFRRVSFVDVDILASLVDAVKNIPTAWLAGDYDAFTTLCMAIEYVQRLGSTMFMQLVGVLVFFVPRTFWPSKPVGSGYTVARASGMSFTNISMPLPGEGYINFGLAGVVLFAFLIGFIVSNFDNAYWSVGTEDSTRTIDLIYPLVMLMFFFISRGDLLSSWAYTFANIVIWIVFCLMVEILSHVRLISAPGGQK